MKIEVGAAYYPEDWDNERVRYDAGLMRDAGVACVRMGEFAWSHMEPREGKFDFQWLRDAVAIFGEYGIRTILCTPSSAAPAWMCHDYPEILRVLRDGSRAWFGVRDHTCYTSAKYREFVLRIARKMAEAFKDDKNVEGWQIDNEPGCSRFPDCFCPDCQNAFRAYVRARYKTLENLNKSWGTTFWSGEFSSWDEIELENRAENMASCRTLDSRRFRCGEEADFILFQAREIRRVIPGAFIGTNNYVLGDRYKVFSGLDFAGNDLYPRNPAVNAETLFYTDLYRGLKPGAPPWLLETNIAPCWPRHDFMRLYFWMFAGHGYDHIFYFHWNNHLAGNEKDHTTIICPDGKPAAKYAMLKALIAEAEALPVSGSVSGEAPPPAPECALVYEYDQHWIYALGYAQRQAFVEDCGVANHAALANEEGGVEIISQHFDFSKYKLLVLPVMPCISKEFASKLEAYVNAGGVAVLNGRAGMFDSNAKNLQEDGPSHLGRLLGLTVGENMPLFGSESMPEYDGRGADSEQTVVSGRLGGEAVEGAIGIWTGYISADGGTEVLLTFANSVLEGYPFLTRNRFGKGHALYYAADAVDKGLLGKILRYAASLAGLQSPGLPSGVDAARRGNLLFLTNFNGKSVEFNSVWKGKNLIGEALRGTRIVLPAYGSAILELQ